MATSLLPSFHAMRASAGSLYCLGQCNLKNKLFQVEQQGYKFSLSSALWACQSIVSLNVCKHHPWLPKGKLHITGSGRASDDASLSQSEPTNVDSVKSQLMRFFQEQAGYTWLLGPILSTASVVIPAILVSVPDLLKKSYWSGLAIIFGMDIIFILSSDIFLVLADRAGHHQKIPGGPLPWIGPWEDTGYLDGLPYLTKLARNCGLGVGFLALILSLIRGKLPVAIAIFGPYLALILIQVAYEKILENDKVAVYPIVSIIYTVYRFRQLARGRELMAIFGFDARFNWIMCFLQTVCTADLTMFLAQIPWLYSTWNSKSAT
eukprot:c25522_g1_i3 orf=557-1516(-)